ncbi:MAG: hypothetical protein M0Q24_11050 [Sulfurimonas sp.]|jgi:ubiquinone biosynthesis protein UbiJ|uniref:hypothetical protein n=1 Tax=Sulfurimonas sp. TaxID=2022749 RepID=UPI0025E0412C|nr:hypothetical protein [Sulfurimonas sp.]MCK9492611.1 hypothetical protein [Sulfurimonas sp.]
MNKKRRNRLEKVFDELTEIITEEQDAIARIPESFANSDRVEKMEDNLDVLADVLDNIQSVINND